MSMKKYLKNLSAIIREDRMHIIIILFLVSLFFFYIDCHFLDIGFLPLHSIDEYAFHGSLLNIYSGIIGFSPSLMFRTGFYSYGFLYFFINFIFSLPFLIFAKTSITILIPKVVSSISAVVMLLYVYKFYALFADKKIVIFPILAIILMPGFWMYGSWFHPDMMMSCFLVMTAYQLAEDRGGYGKNYWLAGLFYALSLSIKFQAITYFPLFAFYNLFYSSKSIKDRFVKFIKISLMAVGIFILTNPYILHSLGFNIFKQSLSDNIASNTTNHGQIGDVGFMAKINLSINHEYYNIFFIILIVIGVARFARYLWQGSNRISLVIFTTFLMNLIYLLFFVNKSWGWYYLPVMLLGILTVAPLIGKFNRTRVIVIASLFVCVQFILNINYVLAVADFSDWNKEYENNIMISDFIVESLKGDVKKGDNILISPYTGFSFERLGLDYKNVFMILGPISSTMVDEELYQKSVSKKFASNEANIFKPFFDKKYIILRKNDIYFDKEKMALIADKEGYERAIELIDDLYSNKTNYRKLNENSEVVIFRKISSFDTH